jgi:hypothetical protein
MGQELGLEVEAMKKISVISILVGIALAATASALHAQSSSSTMSKSESFSGKTAVKSYELAMTDSMGVSRLKITAQIESGEVSWRLLDPQGETKLTGHGESGDVSGDSGDLKPIAGTWTLEVELRNATGKYEINWTAR